jgi:predicted GH43/DUF377 family glycosyl hydrolase
MKISVYSLLFVLILLSGCGKDNPVVPPVDNTGSLVLKIDRENAPASVVLVQAVLRRSGFQPITAEMNLQSDSTADVNLTNVPVGQWHLKVDAKNQQGIVEYTGGTDVTIIENTIIQVTLTLYPVSGGTGGIYIFVTWGDQPLAWTDAAVNPVLKPSQGPAYPQYVTQCRVIYDNGIYKMWYNAVYPGAVASVWYAESPDGKSWNTIGTQPVLKKSNYGWDSYSVTVTEVIKENDNTYKMYYVGWNAHPYSGIVWKTGLAVSNDGINWEKHANPVIADNGQYNFTILKSVVKHENLYYGHFGYFNSYLTRTYVGTITSTDGINWTYYNSNPVISGTLPWEGKGPYNPSVTFEDGKFKMYYEDGYQTAFAYAESVDGFNFVKEDRPVFKKSQTKNNWSSIAFPSYLKVNNERRIYYTGYDGSISNGICFIYK